MPHYRYVALGPAGERVTGVLEADHTGTLTVKLRQSNLLVIDASERREPLRLLRRRARRVGRKQIARFYSQLADLLRSGVPIVRSLDTLDRQYRESTLGPVIKDVRGQVADGRSLAEAMGKHPREFSELAVSMIRAGQEGGFLEDVLKRIAQFTERQEELRGKVIGALAYPMFLLVVGLVVVCGLMVFFVPRFEPMFQRLTDEGELPAITVVVLGASHVLAHYGIVLVVCLAGLGFLIGQWLRTSSGRLWFDTVRLRLPGLGHVHRNLAIVRFCRILGTLLTNGIPILRALRTARESTGNVVLSQAIAKAAENVSSGDTLTEPLRTSGLFPPDVIEMIAVAEESNSLERVLLEIADTTEAYTTRQMDLAVRLLEPVLLLFMAGITLCVAAGLLLPIFRMSSAL